MVDTELDVQKEVVESLAADKAVLDEKIKQLEAEKAALEAEKAALAKAKEEAEAKIETARAGVVAEKEAAEKALADLQIVVGEMKSQLQNVGDILARNSEKPLSNQVSVLDRNEEVPDRFDGETREHILEVLKEAHAAAEAEGRLRRAQLLEGVLAANEATGELQKRRDALTKLFADNLNIINGQVINELDKLDIRYKDGETYLLAKEIITRSY